MWIGGEGLPAVAEERHWYLTVSTCDYSCNPCGGLLAFVAHFRSICPPPAPIGTSRGFAFVEFKTVADAMQWMATKQVWRKLFIVQVLSSCFTDTLGFFRAFLSFRIAIECLCITAFQKTVPHEIKVERRTRQGIKCASTGTALRLDNVFR